MFRFSDTALAGIYDKIMVGERLSFDDGVTLFKSKDLLGIGYLANTIRERLNGNRAYFIVNRHINYTNVCKNMCRFCAFGKEKGDPGAFALSIKDILEKADRYREYIHEDEEIWEFHIVGGLNPELSLAYYLEMLSSLKARYPGAHLQALTAVEIGYIALISRLSIEDTLKMLKDAGLDSIPGGGAEIFSPRVRKLICPEKISGDEWLKIMETAHKLGIRSNATMLYGHIETMEERVEHLLRLRELQDKTRGFMTFIPLAYHPKNTMLGKLHNLQDTTGFDDLKTMAISRLILDNFPHIKSFWIMLGLKIAQLSLSFGADDVDGTVVEEKITHAAGARTAQGVTKKDLIEMIKEAGKVPVERDTVYEKLKVWD